jgi:hypothetical protein
MHMPDSKVLSNLQPSDPFQVWKHLEQNIHIRRDGAGSDGDREHADPEMPNSHE